MIILCYKNERMAAITYQISVFTESILVMETYLIGVVEVDPRMILEDGIRKEMIRLICKILNQTLVFKSVKILSFLLLVLFFYWKKHNFF